MIWGYYPVVARSANLLVFCDCHRKCPLPDGYKLLLPGRLYRGYHKKAPKGFGSLVLYHVICSAFQIKVTIVPRKIVS
uniref:Cl581_1 n=1 Tax=Arundo donax TaxID=35708 RepID=A0A0A9ETN9_ARUDO